MRRRRRRPWRRPACAARSRPPALGRYVYWKRKSDHFVLCEVDVFPLQVSAQLEDWREKGQREARWFTPEDAAYRILELDLASLILGLPDHLSEA